MKITYSIDNNIGCIVLSNPPYNRLTHPVFEEPARLAHFLATPDLRGVLVKGEGRHFCAGADVDILRQQVGGNADFGALLDSGKMLLRQLGDATVPMAAVIRGSCLGAGLEIALACDFRFAAESAMLGFPESEHGLMPGYGGTVANLGALRRSTLIELVVSGRMLNGQEAAALGLVDKCGTSAAIEQQARDFLVSITSNRSSRLIRAVMQSIRNGRRLGRDEALRRETELFMELARASADS